MLDQLAKDLGAEGYRTRESAFGNLEIVYDIEVTTTKTGYAWRHVHGDRVESEWKEVATFAELLDAIR
jgi:hypothetical protein